MLDRLDKKGTERRVFQPEIVGILITPTNIREVIINPVPRVTEEQEKQQKGYTKGV